MGKSFKNMRDGKTGVYLGKFYNTTWPRDLIIYMYITFKVNLGQNHDSRGGEFASLTFQDCWQALS